MRFKDPTQPRPVRFSGTALSLSLGALFSLVLGACANTDLEPVTSGSNDSLAVGEIDLELSVEELRTLEANKGPELTRLQHYVEARLETAESVVEHDCEEPPEDPDSPTPRAACSLMGKSHSILADNNHRIGWTLCNIHFPSGSEARSAVEAVFRDFNRVQGSDVHFFIAGSAPHTDYSDARKRNGFNKIDFTEEGCSGDDCSFTGRARTHKNIWNRIKECDVVLTNERGAWDFGHPTNFNSAGMVFKSTLAHELGHCLGFGHTSEDVNWPSIMGHKTGLWLDDHVSKRVGIKAFDHEHMRLHYPESDNGPLPDLLLTNYKTEDNGNKFATVANAMMSATEVRPGESIHIKWTRMNTGNQRVSGQNAYHTIVVLSSNNVLSPNDTVIKRWSHSGTVRPGSTLYADTHVTIPSSMAPGSYYVGLIIDSDNEVRESNEGNNILRFRDQLTVLQ